MIRWTIKALLAFGAVLSSVTLPVACVSEDPGATATPLTCDSYCTEILKSCGGDNRQYRSRDECLTTCKLLDLGTERDGDVNSISCRLRKATSAKTLSDCVAAGPFGGGVCGQRCDAFCQMIGANCLTVSSPPFQGSQATCNEICPTFKFDPTEGEGPNQSAFSGKDTINCRSHHLILSLAGPADRETHCPHADAVSAQCK